MSGDRVAAWQLPTLWRRSLLLRVTTTTLLLSVVVVGVLGILLFSRVTSGLLESAERDAIAEASAGLADAQRVSSAVDTTSPTDSLSRQVDTIVTALATRAGSPPQYDVLLLSTSADPTAPERGTNLVSVASVPDDLRSAISSTGRQAWTFTEIRYLDGRSAPGLVVGAPLTVAETTPYELYYLFPLTDQAATLDLVRSAVIATAALLVILLGVIALVVTRQVVAPVRAAARVAERFSEGHLEERMQVEGEDDLARLATSFNEMAGSLESQIDRLESLSQLQQRFVSDVSHELRTPLTTIRMAADVLFEARAAYDPMTARSAELLQTQLDRFEALLADLLEISRHDAGAAVLELDRLDLMALVTRAREAAIPLAARRGSEITLAGPDEPCLVEGDARRVDRVLRNLLENAIEHGEGRPIDITVGGTDEAAWVDVRDYGVGIAEDHLPHVFDRFWRADPARARTMGGTGLGLAIALEDTRLHGGILEVSADPGRGALFRLVLPRTAGALPADPGAAGVPPLTLDDPPAPVPPAEAALHEAGLGRAGDTP